jgi:hypothetical protein
MAQGATDPRDPRAGTLKKAVEQFHINDEEQKRKQITRNSKHLTNLQYV